MHLKITDYFKGSDVQQPTFLPNRTVVWRSEGARTDLIVVFIHGLHGHSVKTWALDPHAESWLSWIRSARQCTTFISLGYDVSISEWLGGSMSLYDRAVNLIESLDGYLADDIPVLILAHSYGGLLAKQIVRLSSDNKPRWKLANALRAIVFFGTPHSGSRLASIGRRIAWLFRGSRVVPELSYGSPDIIDLNRWFRHALPALNLEVSVFTEHHRSLGLEVVDDISADPGLYGVIPIKVDSDHSNLARPKDIEDIRVQKVLRVIETIFECPLSFHQRIIVVENLRRTVEAHAQIDDRLYDDFCSAQFWDFSKHNELKLKLETYRRIVSGYGQANERRLESQRSGLVDLLKCLQADLELNGGRGYEP